MGASIYLDPPLITSVWPYSVKSLGARMFASMLLALAVVLVGSFIAGARSSAKGVLVTVTPIFTMVLVAALANLGTVYLAGVRGEEWIAIFGLVVGLGAFLIWSGRNEHDDETQDTRPVPRGLRVALVLHTVIVVFFGLNMLFLPTLALNFWPWNVSGIVMQGLGGFFIGSAAGTGWAAMQKHCEAVRKVLPSYFSFTLLVLVAVALDSGVIASESPGLHVTVTWLSIYLYVTIYSIYYFLRLGGLRGWNSHPLEE